MENVIPFAYCNLVGSEGETTYWDGSRIIGAGDPATRVPGAPVISQVAYDTPDLVCSDVDYAVTHRMRPLFPILRDLRAEVDAQLASTMHDKID